MSDSYMTKRYTVTALGDGYEVTDLRGKRLRWVDTFSSACEIADLYQADDDHDAAHERWDVEHGGDQ